MRADSLFLNLKTTSSTYLITMSDNTRRCQTCKAQRKESDFIRGPTGQTYITCNHCSARAKARATRPRPYRQPVASNARICSDCEKEYPAADFIRREKEFRTCNRCAEKRILRKRALKLPLTDGMKRCWICKVPTPESEFT